MAVPTKHLPSGAQLPVIGLGVYQCKPGAETYTAVLTALKIGYRHIDTAQFYANEADVGQAVRDSGIPRNEIFLTTKLEFKYWGYDATIAGVRASNSALNCGYIDLLLLHAPGASEGRAQSWRALEDLQAQGVVKDIGVSNFGEAHLRKLAETARVQPAVNQIELHPWLARTELVAYCNRQGIVVQAYSPLANGCKLQDPVVQEIAKELQATAGQVLIAYSLAMDYVTIPKSANIDRQRENFEARKIQLNATHLAKLQALDEYLIIAWDPIKDHPV